MNALYESDRQSAGIQNSAPELDECLRILECNPDDLSSLPYVNRDVTAGTENEMQVAVKGSREKVDLPRTILESTYYANMKRRTRSGDTPRAGIRSLGRYLDDHSEEIWENSWVRFPRCLLNEYSQTILRADLQADKNDPRSSLREDAARFTLFENGEHWLRIPISYLLKLSLADIIGTEAGEAFEVTGKRLLSHFLNDNTSPETFSFHVVHGPERGGVGQNVARETAKRFLMSSLLLDYANKKFKLEKNGQKALLFFSPHPPIRQRMLNENISDAFYRELFMSPCLSGWDKGEAKHEYMSLCHQVLSRSHLNAVMKLREAGIIANNLVVLPNTSNVSLANNGTHVSLGSRRLTELSGKFGGLTPAHEKQLGDMSAKIIEHFLPLFVGTYSAAPYRLDFEDFHPEKVLGYLPHQLDFTHLRMIWRRWKKKAKNNFFGHHLTPFGPNAFDRFIGRSFGLKGDYVPDFRLVDYPVSLLSTEANSSQNGRLGNEQLLKNDLDSLGVFDKRMSLYQLVKLREFAVMGFSGYEARYYSLFYDFTDLSEAVNLQTLLGALSYKYMVSDNWRPGDIPSTPEIESERRQIIFGTALGIPTFFVHKDTGNLFLKRILAKVKLTRSSRRYPGYLRVHNAEYRLALVELILEDAKELIEIMGLEQTLVDLKTRLKNSEYTALGKIEHGIMGSFKKRTKPLDLTAHEFNREAERYYREDLRVRHLIESWGYFAEDLRAIVEGRIPVGLEQRDEIDRFCGGRTLDEALELRKKQVASGMVDEDIALNLVRLMLLAERFHAKADQ
ncbi:MAG: hypothetical protein KKG47_12475 [Proteobacteria bacterium]|nr:hypothetical protein [Pseudomonadota bacterium]MBU1739207.1 hypothetical protein [Pseudomonadota bacterium]